MRDVERQTKARMGKVGQTLSVGGGVHPKPHEQDASVVAHAVRILYRDLQSEASAGSANTMRPRLAGTAVIATEL